MNNKVKMAVLGAFLVVVALLTTIDLCVTNNLSQKPSIESDGVYEAASFATDTIHVSRHAKMAAMDSGPEMSFGGSSQAQFASPAMKRVILKTSSVDMEVENIDLAINKIQLFLQKEAPSGYVASINQRSNFASLDIRVPTEILEQFVEKLKTITEDAHVNYVSFHSNDVTEEWYDLEGRLKVLQASRERYYELLKQAKNVQEVISVQSQIDSLNEKLERILGRRNYLESHAKLSTINVTLRKRVQQSAPWQFLQWVNQIGVLFQPLQQVDRGLFLLARLIATLINTSILVVTVSVPLLTVIGLIFLFIKKRRAYAEARHDNTCSGKR